MKLVSFVSAGRASYGVVKDGGVIDLGRRFGDRWPTLRALLAADALAEAGRVERDAKPDLRLEGLELAPVIPDPDKIICVGLNYRAHVEETGRTVTEKPALFARFTGSQVGHLQPLAACRTYRADDRLWETGADWRCRIGMLILFRCDFGAHGQFPDDRSADGLSAAAFGGRVVAREASGSVHRRSDRRSRPGPDERGLPRL